MDAPGLLHVFPPLGDLHKGLVASSRSLYKCGPLHPKQWTWTVSPRCRASSMVSRMLVISLGLLGTDSLTIGCRSRGTVLPKAAGFLLCNPVVRFQHITRIT